MSGSGDQWWEDQDFMRSTTDQLLTALGVSDRAVKELPRLAELVSFEKSAELLSGDQGQSDPAEQAAAEVDYQAVLGIVAPVARQLLRGLRREGVRLEIFGVDSRAVGDLVAQMDAMASSTSLSGDDVQTLEQAFSTPEPFMLEELTRPSGKEVRSLVRILKRMPDQTLRRIAPGNAPLKFLLTRSFVLRLVVRIALMLLRRARREQKQEMGISNQRRGVRLRGFEQTGVRPRDSADTEDTSE